VALLSPETIELLNECLSHVDQQWLWDRSQWDEISALIAQAQVEVEANAMIGSIIHFGGNLPPHLLVCDGSEYQREDYPDLYAILDATYITGADTFAVPNLINRFILGNDGTDLDATGGAESVTLSVAQMPEHTHADAGHVHSTHSHLASVAFLPDSPPISTPSLFPAATGTGYANIQSAGGDEAHENMPPYRKLVPCIVAF
jgi:microcystin-dependent protein